MFIILLIQNSYANSKFEIEGFSLGMMLSDKLNDQQISKGIQQNRLYQNKANSLVFLNQSFFPKYDLMIFSFKKKDKKKKIINIEARNLYENDNINECYESEERLIKELTKNYEDKKHRNANHYRWQNYQSTNTNQ